MQQRRAGPHENPRRSLLPLSLMSALLAPALLVAGCGLKEHPHTPAIRPGEPPPAVDAGGPVTAPDARAQDGRLGADGPAPPRPPDGGPTPDAAPAASAPPTVAPGGVTVDGRVLPREQVIVMLHIGHSNMAGRARNPASERPYFYDPHPQLWVYARGGAFRAAREPTSPDNMTQGRAGPGMALLRNALARAPSALIISIGHGHTGPAGGVCRSYRKGGLLYDIVMGPAVELRGKVTFGAIFAMFGISEVNDMANATRVGECLEGVAREMRADLGDPDVPFVIGGWEQAMTDLGPDSEVAQIIMPQLALVPMRIPRALLIPTEGLPIEEDDHHYTMTGHRLWAERGFDLLTKANLIPWATAPP